MVRVLDKILRAGEGKILRKLKAISVQVNALEEQLLLYSNDIRLTDDLTFIEVRF